MKKLLLLISLLLATNAWGAVKTLNCEIDEEYEDKENKVIEFKILIEINFDLELRNAEVTESTTLDDPIMEYLSVLLVTPTKLTFTGIAQTDDGKDFNVQLTVNRQDLEITYTEKETDNIYPVGKCQIVRAKKTLI